MTDFRDLIRDLTAAGIRFEDPLADAEVVVVQDRFGFVFPEDLRAFLQTALPVSRRFPDWRFPDWRSGDEAELRRQLAWPLEGLEFDVRNNLWSDCWGPRPEAIADRLKVVRAWVADAPTLITVYGHRYMPERPSTAGNPVLSVYQSDMMRYGSDLADYLRNEFLRPEDEMIRVREDVRPVEGWQAFL